MTTAARAGDGATAQVDVSRLILVSLLAICALSVPVFCTRFLNDMDYYSLVADKLVGGGMLYRDAIDTKPPLVFVHYALVFTLFGKNNITAVKIVTMVWLGASALVICFIRKELFPSTRTPELTVPLFVLASFSGWGEDFLSSNTEILSNLFVLLGVWCMVKDDFSGHIGRLLLAGALVGVAFLYRYQAGAPLAAYFFTVVLLRKRFSRALLRLFCLGIGFLIPVGIVVAYYLRAGALRDLAFLLRYQSYYLSGHDQYWPQALGQGIVVLVSQGPFLLLAGWQVAAMLRARTLFSGEVFLLLLFGLSFSTFFVGGHYYAHYIVQAIPPMVLLAAERLSQVDTKAPLTRMGRFGALSLRHARTLILVNVSIFWLVNTAYYRSLRPDPPHANLVRFAARFTTPRDSAFVWTWQSSVLFEIDRAFATRFLSNEFLTGRLHGTRQRLSSATVESARTAAVLELWPVLMQDLEALKPRLIVDDARDRSNFTIDHYPVLASFVEEHYEPCRLMDGLCVYLRQTQ